MSGCLLDCFDVIRGDQKVVQRVALGNTSQIASVPVKELDDVGVVDARCPVNGFCQWSASQCFVAEADSGVTISQQILVDHVWIVTISAGSGTNGLVQFLSSIASLIVTNVMMIDLSFAPASHQTNVFLVL